MKIEAEVTGVENGGEYLRVEMKGLPTSAAEWRSRQHQSITIPAGENAGRTFFVGRKIEISIRPK